MKKYNIHDAKTNLSKIISEVKEGEAVYICKSGTPIAELKPISEHKQKKRVAGQYKGMVKYSPDYEEFDKEIENWFEEDNDA